MSGFTGLILSVGFEPIKKTMTVNRFETIRRFLHFNNNEKHFQRDHPQHDRLHKIRPIISHLNEKFASVPMEQRLSIDEAKKGEVLFNMFHLRT